MYHGISGLALGSVVAAGLLLSGCGGAGGPRIQPVPKDPYAYDASKPLLVQNVGTSDYGPVRVTSLTYVTFDGTRVPALFAIPRGHKTTGCLMYQPGLGTPKQGAAEVWPGAARIGLAVFTIDPRLTGARAGGRITGHEVETNLQLFVRFFRDDVIDLRRGLDYLEGQAACRHKVAYMGVSEGGELGLQLAGEDARIRAAVLCSVGATWRARLFYSPVILPGFVNYPTKFKAALTELAPLNQTRWIAKISPRPVMILDGLVDPNIPVADGLDLAAAARQPKLLVLHPGGHNPFAGAAARADADQVGEFLVKNLIHGDAAS